MSNDQRWTVAVAIYAVFVVCFHTMAGHIAGSAFVAGWAIGATSVMWIDAKAEREGRDG